MNNLNVLDQFMQAFIHYIESGLGLLSGGDVSFLSRTLIANASEHQPAIFGRFSLAFQPAANVSERENGAIRA